MGTATEAMVQKYADILKNSKLNGKDKKIQIKMITGFEKEVLDRLDFSDHDIREAFKKVTATVLDHCMDICVEIAKEKKVANQKKLFKNMAKSLKLRDMNDKLDIGKNLKSSIDFIKSHVNLKSKAAAKKK